MFKEIVGEKHRKRHEELHRALDELLADFLAHTKALPSKTPITELLEWSSNQTIIPSETEEPLCPKKS